MQSAIYSYLNLFFVILIFPLEMTTFLKQYTNYKWLAISRLRNDFPKFFKQNIEDHLF